MRKEIYHWVTYPSEFGTTHHPIFGEGSTQRDHQDLQHREEVYVSEHGIARLMHESCQREVLKAKTTLDSLGEVVRLVNRFSKFNRAPRACDHIGPCGDC